MPVTVGFLAGISVHILVSQMPGVLGVPPPEGPLPSRVIAVAENFNDANSFTLVIGFGVLAVIAISERISARFPGALIALIAATVAVMLMGLESRGVTTVGVISGALPSLAIPELPIARWARLVPLGLLIAAVVMVQTAATTRSFPSDPAEPADGRNWPACSQPASYSPCWRSAPSCCGMFPMPRSAAFCCSSP
jgi:SulP family sulfate permease